MGGQVRGRTKDECWRNYLDDKRTRGGLLLHVIPGNKQEAYKAMKKDNEIGIWTLDFVFTNADELMLERGSEQRDALLVMAHGAEEPREDYAEEKPSH